MSALHWIRKKGRWLAYESKDGPGQLLYSVCRIGREHIAYRYVLGSGLAHGESPMIIAEKSGRGAIAFLKHSCQRDWDKRIRTMIKDRGRIRQIIEDKEAESRKRRDDQIRRMVEDNTRAVYEEAARILLSPRALKRAPDVLWTVAGYLEDANIAGPVLPLNRCRFVPGFEKLEVDDDTARQRGYVFVEKAWDPER